MTQPESTPGAGAQAAKPGNRPGDTIPLTRRYPSLAHLPRAVLGTFPSPVHALDLRGVGGRLWIKRDDLNAPAYGGNKVRSLEFLLGELGADELVLTLGATGSTHIMSTAAHARRLGARVRAIRFPQEMNPVAERVAEETRAIGTELIETRSIVTAFLRAWLARSGPRTRWIPLGGTSPRGVLGHINAGLELAEQIAAGSLPTPARVVVPLGTAGTAAGLALGFAIAGIDTTVVGARTAPRIATNELRILRVARAARRFLERATGATVPHVHRSRVRAWHGAYAGAYGRPHPFAREAAGLLRESLGLVLDETYSAKALAGAVELTRREHGDTLFWLTFDARWMSAR